MLFFKYSRVKFARTVDELKNFLASRGGTVGFVPTMGYLHEGHLSLVRVSKKECDTTVVSIFVNPTQFGPEEDFERYPRDLERDRKMLENLQVDVVFVPTVEEIYGNGISTAFLLGKIAECLCGKSRPHHFPGVALVVSKLFHMVKPDKAYFGQKDYQQTLVVKQVVRDLNFDVDVVVCPTAREADGLAMSSRNVHLSPEEMKGATILFRSLKHISELVRKGEKNVSALERELQVIIQSEPLAKIDYAEIRSAVDLSRIETIDKPCVAAVAVYFGKTRLIDNILL